MQSQAKRHPIHPTAKASGFSRTTAYNAAIITLATAAGDVGDWQATFIISEHTDLAHQKVVGTLTMGDTIAHLTDYDVDTTDFAGAITVKTQVVSGHGSDTIVQEMGIVEFLP